jgi:hypothetical protein
MGLGGVACLEQPECVSGLLRCIHDELQVTGPALMVPEEKYRRFEHPHISVMEDRVLKSRAA